MNIWHVALQVKGYSYIYDIIVVGAADGLDATERAKELVRQRYALVGETAEFANEDTWLEPVVNGAVLVKVG